MILERQIKNFLNSIKHLKQKEIKKVENEPNMYNITMVDDNLKNPTTYLVKVEILPDEKQYQIYFMEEIPKTDKSPIYNADSINNLITNVDTYNKKVKRPTDEIIKLIEELRKTLNEIIKSYPDGLSEYDFASKIAERFQNDEISLGNVARILKIKNREYFTKLDNLSKPKENEEEKYNWCPIGPKYKNFM